MSFKRYLAKRNSRILQINPQLHFNSYNVTTTYFNRNHTTHTSSPPPSTSSINHAEISHFDALASSWWDPHGPSRILHLMNPPRHAFLAKCLTTSGTLSPTSTSRSTTSTTSTPTPHKSTTPPAKTTSATTSETTTSTTSTTTPTQQPTLRILDIGCGGGIFAESAARLPFVSQVVGIDASADVLAVAVAHARCDPAVGLATGRLRYVHGAVEEVGAVLDGHGSEVGSGSDSGKFDVVTVFEVLEHVNQPAAFLRECMARVRPGGWLVMSTIARSWTSWVVTKLVAEDVLGVVPRGTHDWHKYINEGELRAFFAKEGGGGGWGSPMVMGVVYVPGLGWREVTGGEELGNYFFGIRKMG